MSSAPYPVVQKMTSSRRRTRAPARRFRFLVGEGTLRREGSVFSSDDARLDKTISSSRRTLCAPTTRFRFLVGGPVLRRDDSIFSSEDPCSGETTPVSGRRGRIPARRFRFLAGEDAFRPENSAFWQQNASSDEKTAFSRRWPRAPTRRLRFLVVHGIQPDSCDRLSDISSSKLCILTSRSSCERLNPNRLAALARSPPQCVNAPTIS